MYSKLIYLSFLFLLVSCSTPFREPVCHEGNVSFPPNIEGRYRLNVIDSDQRYSGAFLPGEDWELYVRVEDEKLVGYAHPKEAQALKRRVNGWSNQGRKVIAQFFIGTMCKIGEHYYAETSSEDNLFRLSRYDVSASGFVMTGIIFHPEQLAKYQIPYYFYPKVATGSAGEGQVDFGWFSSEFIIDNRRLSPDDLERLFKLARLNYVGTVFTRLPDKPMSDRYTRL